MSEEYNNNNDDFFDEVEGEEEEVLDIPKERRQIYLKHQVNK